MDVPGLWTLDQLTEQVGTALAVDYAGAPSGRVRSVPDRRAIRWYTTIGLVDRPAAMRGRTALYAERHLLQLVAIKRRQADGRSLAEIQTELAGATDASLRSIAQLPNGTPTTPRAPATPRADRFWSATAATTDSTAAGPSIPTATAATTDSTAAGELSVHAASASGCGSGTAGVAVAPAISLPGGIALLLPAGTPYPTDDDLLAIRTAATRLLAELNRRGLTDTDTTKG
jgi:DNA-binding transcriptional MerR regulator